MANLPPLDLLEATHEFPGPYTVKVIGSVRDGFVERVVAAVRDEMALEADPEFQVRETANGRHVAVSLHLRPQSALEVHAVYSRLMKVPGVVILL